MVVLFHCYRLFYHRISGVSLLIIALSVVVILDPLAIYSQGFWLSFLAVTILLYGFTNRFKERNFIKSNDDGHDQGRGLTCFCCKRVILNGWRIFQQICLPLVKSQWLLAIGLLLPSIILLQGISLGGYIANFFAISFVSFVVVPLIFVLLLFMLLGWFFNYHWLREAAELIYLANEKSITLLLKVLTELEALLPRFLNLSFTFPTFFSIFLFVVGALWLLAPKGIPYRYLGLCACLPALFSIPPPKNLRVTFLDVGQGTSVLVETRSHLLVYDAGRSYSESFNVGEHIVAPYIRSLSHKYIDKVMISHGDSDHAGGLEGLLTQLPVKELVLGQPLKHQVRSRAKLIPISQCLAGQHWRWDDVQFTVLWPEQSYLFKPRLKNNNTSCVLLISYRGNHYWREISKSVLNNSY